MRSHGQAVRACTHRHQANPPRMPDFKALNLPVARSGLAYRPVRQRKPPDPLPSTPTTSPRSRPISRLHPNDGRFWGHVAGNGTKNTFQTRKFRINVSPTKDNSSRKRTETLSEIFLVDALPAVCLRSGGRLGETTREAAEDFGGNVLQKGANRKVRALCRFPRPGNRRNPA